MGPVEDAAIKRVKPGGHPEQIRQVTDNEGHNRREAERLYQSTKTREQGEDSARSAQRYAFAFRLQILAKAY
jgi:hypothetical protein